MARPGTPTRILVPTDFSAAAQTAVTLARRLAATWSAELHLLHVRVLLEAPLMPEEEQVTVDRLLSESERETARALVKQAGTAEQVPTHTHVVRGVSPAEAIVATCLNLGCDLVAMGTHGHRGLKHLLLGSVAEAVVRTAPTPVLTVHPDASLSDPPVRHVLLPHDFSEPSDEAARLATLWCQALGARLTLLHVVEPVVYPEFYAVDLMPDDLLHRIRARSEEALARFAAEELAEIQTEAVVVSGRAGQAITREAEARGCDLVVMGKRGLNALEHLFLGSVAEKVVRSCRVPVLSVRPPDRA